MIELLQNERRAFVLNYFDDRFGVGAGTFDKYQWYEGSKGRVYVMPKDIVAPKSALTAGLLLARIHDYVKPSTDFFQVFDRLIVRNYVPMTRQECLSYVAGNGIAPNKNALAGATPGYVLLRYNGVAVACGYLRGELIENVLGKAKTLALEFL